MAVVTTNSKEVLLGNSSCTEFSVGFKCAYNKDQIPYISVYLADQNTLSEEDPVILTYGVDYKVDTASDTGFRLIYPISGAPLPADKRLIVLRNTPLIQNVFSTSVPERKPIENIGDYLTMIIQELSETLSRAPKIPITSEYDPNTLIAEVIDKMNDAIANSTTALSITSGMQESVNAASQSAQDAALTAREALLVAAESSHAHLNKSVLDEFGTTGSNKLTFNGEKIALADDLSVMVQTDATNASAESFRALVGMPEVEEDITGLQAEIASTGSAVTAIDSRVLALENKDITVLNVAPQTIVAGPTGDLPDGWTTADADLPAAHIITSGTSELTVVAGLQVAAGVEGSTVLSNTLSADTTLNISAATDITSGTYSYYIYADLDANKNLTFGVTDKKPQVGLNPEYAISIVTPIMTANVDQGFTVAASSVGVSSEYNPYEAFNRVAATKYNGWSSAANYTKSDGIYMGEEYIRIYKTDLTQLTANKVRLCPYSEGSTMYGRPYQFNIEAVAEDGTITVLAAINEYNDWAVGEYLEIEFDTTTTTYLQIRVLKVYGGSYCAFSDIQWVYDENNASSEFQGDFFNIANQTHYDAYGNILRRVYIGEIEVEGGAVSNVINYQHGTVYTLPVNDGENIAVNSWYYSEKPYLGECNTTAEMYYENKWGDTGWIYTNGGYGVNSTISEDTLIVVTGNSYLCTSDGNYGGGVFSGNSTSAPARVKISRQY